MTESGEPRFPAPAGPRPPASALSERVPPAFALDPSYPRHAPQPEQLRAALWSVLADRDWAGLGWPGLLEALIGLGRTDIPLSRLAEGHVDAVRIADQAGRTLAPGALYGVWASRSGATGVRARPDGGQLRIEGTLRFASGAGVIDRALVPVWIADGRHLLVDLDVHDLPVDSSGWQTGAMSVSRTHTVSVDAVAVPVASVLGGPDFYLDRPGFFPGGVGVAAVWVGGLSRVLDTLLDRLGGQRTSSVDLRLGRLATQRSLALALVRQGGLRLDAGLTAGAAPPRDQLHRLATQIRAGVAQCVHTALTEARTIAGPVGLAFDAPLTHAIDDLDLYVRQQNGDADDVLLGAGLRP